MITDSSGKPVASEKLCASVVYSAGTPLAVIMKLSAVVIPVSARKLVNGRSASSGMIWSNASPTAAPIPVCVTVMASPSIPAT